MPYIWSTLKKRNCSRHESLTLEVSNHPLKLTSVVVRPVKKNDFVENLNKWSSAFEEIDPLLRFEQNNAEEPEVDPELESKPNLSKIWDRTKASILHKYTTGEKLTIISSFLPGTEKALIRQVSNLNEKVKHRLVQLDEFDEGSVKKTMGLTQQEYVTKINLLHNEIKQAWDTEQRVKAFKIAIQCSKLLSDISVMQFYPSKFVLITNILDMFGDLVFSRLEEKSFGSKKIKSITEIDLNQVPESAKGTCENWIYKMASIRELLPRMYMEMTLLRCYAFISKNEMRPAIQRLTLMIRGIGDPLVAAYLRLYLCRVASKVFENDFAELYYENFKELLDDYQQIFHPSMRKHYESQSLVLDKYISLYMPVMDWLLLGTLQSTKISKYELLDQCLGYCEQNNNNELLLHSVLAAFDHELIIEKSDIIVNLIYKFVETNVLTHELLSSLGEHLCKVTSYKQVSVETLVQVWWKTAVEIKLPVHYLQTMAPWIEFACKFLSSQHINILLRGTVRYIVKSGKPADDFSGGFQIIFKRMLTAIPDIEELFLMDAFMPLVELLQTVNARTMLAKTILSMFFTRYSSVQIEDPIVISSLMRLCYILHDSINAVTVEDECRVSADLIVRVVGAVGAVGAGGAGAEDAELLAYYVDCRAKLIKLDAVLVALVHAVNRLSTRTRNARLQRACAAYSAVTVPALRCALSRLQLHLLGGQVALLNNCLGQAEANLKAFVSLIPDIPEYILEDGQKKSTHAKFGGLISNFLSTLLLLPDNVNSNCKAYILSGFIKTLERIHWRKTDELYYTSLLHALDLLCNMAQEEYPYHIDSVLSNDVLYGSDPEFIEVIEQYATDMCQELLVTLKVLGSDPRKQCNLLLQLLWRVLCRADVAQPSVASLATNLYLLYHKQKDPSTSKLAKSIVSVLQDTRYPDRVDLYSKIKELPV